MLYRRQTSDNFASPQQNLTAYYQSETRKGITLLHQRNTYYRFAIPSPNDTPHYFASPLPDCTTPNPCCTSLYYTIAKHSDTGHRSTQLNFAIAERNDPRPRNTCALQSMTQLYRCHMTRYITSPLLFLTLLNFAIPSLYRNYDTNCINPHNVSSAIPMLSYSKLHCAKTFRNAAMPYHRMTALC